MCTDLFANLLMLTVELNILQNLNNLLWKMKWISC